MSKEQYKENRTRVFEIMNLDPKDRRYNCHHEQFRSEGGSDDISNLFPLKVEDHDKLHKRIQELEGQIKKYSKKNDRKQRENPTPRRIKKKSKRKRR